MSCKISRKIGRKKGVSAMVRFLMLKDKSEFNDKGEYKNNTKRYIMKNLETCKSGLICGDMPELYGGMTIDLDVNNGRVKGYSFISSKKNKEILEKHTEDLMKTSNMTLKVYNDRLELHELCPDIKWNKLTKCKINPYFVYSFKKADKIHKIINDNPFDSSRIFAIQKELKKISRSARKQTFTIKEYLNFFDILDKDSSYNISIFDKLEILSNDTMLSMSNGRITDIEVKEKNDYIKNAIYKFENNKRTVLTTEEILNFINNYETNLSDEQMETLFCLIDNKIDVITGGAGVGKTTVIDALINCYSFYYSKDKITLLAPTGKASRRIKEKTGFNNCTTIHSKLRKSTEDDYTYYNENNKLEEELVIVDESSMIDTFLMYDLLSALDDGAKIIFVGDNNQIAPVGIGEPFFDILNRVKPFKLTKNFRQGDNDILNNANKVLNEETIKEGNGFTIRHCDFKDINNIVRDYEKENSQIMSPFNEVNNLINNYLKTGNYRFNVRDKVVATKNTKEYSNGDIGTIVDIKADGMFINFVDIGTVWVSREESENYKDIELAYSLTIHKMQGSECDNALIFLPEDSRFVNKNLIYTAFTRAKKNVEVIFYKRANNNFNYADINCMSKDAIEFLIASEELENSLYEEDELCIA